MGSNPTLSAATAPPTLVLAGILVRVERVVVLGRGGAGKSVAAARLGELTGLPVIELDQHFWRPGLTAMAPNDWVRVQHDLAARGRWILDGDLGPYDGPPLGWRRLTRC
ncbi:MAG: hypothetical protein ACRDY2_10490 [Acidimicrobiales bacterium]